MRDAEIPDGCLRSFGIYRQNLHTIEGMFAFIEREEAEHNGIANPETRYDAEFGFPAYTGERDVLDGSSYSIRKFRVLKGVRE